MQDSEILENLQNYGATFAKRLRRKTNAGPENSLSVLIGFSTDSAPSEVKIGYLRFHTKEYNPPPMRCYSCNYYGHQAKHCRGKQSCAKCGGRDHLYKDCGNQNECINCHESHSAGYAGCRIYREESKIQILRARENLSYTEARLKLHKTDAAVLTAPPYSSSHTTNPRDMHKVRINNRSINSKQVNPNTTYSQVLSVLSLLRCTLRRNQRQLPASQFNTYTDISTARTHPVATMPPCTVLVELRRSAN